jgi:PAS domain-containing protein
VQRKNKTAATRADGVSRSIVEEALDRISGLLHVLFDTSQDGVVLMAHHRFVDCNPRALSMFGCRTKEELLGKTPGVSHEGGVARKDARRVFPRATA